MAELTRLAGEEHYRNGGRLPSERELAARLGVGRNVVREAMISLATAGVIEKRERLGVFVVPTAPDDIMGNLRQLQLPPAEFMPMQLEVRMMICVPAVELAAERRTDEDLKKLWDCYEAFIQSPYGTPEEETAGAKWEALLHHLETEAAHNPLLSRINESIEALVERNNSFMHHHIMERVEGWLDHIKTQHRTIIGAIEERNPRLAGDTLRTHLVESYELIKKNYPHYLTSSVKLYWGRSEGGCGSQ